MSIVTITALSAKTNNCQQSACCINPNLQWFPCDSTATCSYSSILLLMCLIWRHVRRMKWDCPLTSNLPRFPIVPPPHFHAFKITFKWPVPYKSRYHHGCASLINIFLMRLLSYRLQTSRYAQLVLSAFNFLLANWLLPPSGVIAIGQCLLVGLLVH